MPIGSSMSASADGNTHRITVQVWFVPSGGSQSETVDVAVDWAPQLLQLDDDTTPNPDPAPDFLSATSGLAIWTGEVISEADHPASDPKEFVVTLDCRMRAITSVEASVGIVGGGGPQVYTAALICQNAAT